jgi:hypothetical protein
MNLKILILVFFFSFFQIFGSIILVTFIYELCEYRIIIMALYWQLSLIKILIIILVASLAIGLLALISFHSLFLSFLYISAVVRYLM